MTRTYSNVTGYGKRISNDTKRTLALQSLSKTYGCSRTTIHQQKNIALSAVNKEFEEENNDRILYYILVTKNYIKQAIFSDAKRSPVSI